MKQKILLFLISLNLFVIPILIIQAVEYPQITDKFCDAINGCPNGFECYSFPGIGLRCAQPNPCDYFKCPEETKCAIAESYPERVICGGGRCEGEECESVISYDLSTKNETIIHIEKSNNQNVSQNITLWKATSGNKGVLETAIASAVYSNELTIENAKLFMETSGGKKQINVLPEDAIIISETPNKEFVDKIELKEESQKPIYSVRGIKKVKILFIIPLSMNIETKIDAQTGDKISVNKSWWAFLAK